MVWEEKTILCLFIVLIRNKFIRRYNHQTTLRHGGPGVDLEIEARFEKNPVERRETWPRPTIICSSCYLLVIRVLEKLVFSFDSQRMLLMLPLSQQSVRYFITLFEVESRPAGYMTNANPALSMFFYWEQVLEFKICMVRIHYVFGSYG